jgi:biotin carboxyl carrier protein
MRYRFKTDEDAVDWSVDPGGKDRLNVSMEAQTLDVCHAAISDHHLYIEVDGVGVNAFVYGGNGEKTVIIRGVSYIVKDADLIEQKTKRKRDRKNIPRDITPPMPSVVVRILVNEGDTVQKGDAVIVLTAMKMETTLTALFSGKVAKIHVSAGEKVMPGKILVDIEKAPEADDTKSGGQADI